MWCSKARKCFALAVCAMPLVLASCGFHPLYGQNAADPAVADELASVRVLPIRDRAGQLIHNALLNDLNPTGEPTKPRYQLETRADISESQQALSTDDTATRNRVTYNISFYLYDGKNRVLGGSFSQFFSYDFLPYYYSNTSAADDVHRRAAQAIADEIKNRVAAYFTKAAEVKAQEQMKAQQKSGS